MIAFLIDIALVAILTVAITCTGIGVGMAGVLLARSFLQGGRE
ncbi:hypothetical protein WCE55_00800 [Luteimonas sp. MJ293]